MKSFYAGALFAVLFFIMAAVFYTHNVPYMRWLVFVGVMSSWVAYTRLPNGKETE